MSPESIIKNQYSTKSDIWSFGVTIVEIWTQKTPYPQLALLEVVSEIIIIIIKYIQLIYFIFEPCFQKKNNTIAIHLPIM